MAGKVTDFDALTSPADADVMYIVQTSDNTDKKITVANMKADFGSAQYTVETATDNKVITTSAVNYLLVFTRQATDKTITLDDATASSGIVREIQVTGSGAGNVIIDGNGSQTVGGLTTYTITRNQKIRLISDGSNWVTESQFIYDTGWIANSDWTNASLTVTHNLSANLADLVVKFFVSTDGTDANAFEPKFGVNEGTTTINGFTFIATDENGFTVQTGTDGIRYIQSGGGSVVIDAEAWYYKVVAYKQN